MRFLTLHGATRYGYTENTGPSLGRLAGDAMILISSHHFHMCEYDDETACVRWRGCLITHHVGVCVYQIDTQVERY